MPTCAAPGKEKAPSLTARARSCPVSWTAKVTSDQLNPIIWSWAYISDLLATRSGFAPELPVGELEARLQHFLNVMEITLQASAKHNFMDDSWKVSQLYHTKVQAKVDQGLTTWCKIMERWESATLPHELMAAQQELSTRSLAVDLNEKDVFVKIPRCNTWNTWGTEGLCRYESENIGQCCSYIHECTYCKSRKLQPVDHQLIFCQERLAAKSD